MTGRKTDMQVNVAGLRRNIKNIAHNYSDAQKKVREATSNDPWGPSSTLMSEIADLTYNVVAFTEIMQMIWKRLNDHGRNWRHVYKALGLLEYLIKTGSEKVAQQCKENIFAIQTLRDFQYVEDNRDHGLNVREKAKQLVLLLKDDERLKNERARALKAKERFAQSQTGFGSDVESLSPPSPHTFNPAQGWGSDPSDRERVANRELESARPHTIGEEELQLQLALAMSREEAEQEEQRRRSDDVRLQLALSQSEEEFKKKDDTKKPENTSHLLDLLDVNLVPDGAVGGASAVDPWGVSVVPPQPPARPQSLDVFCTSWASADPWSSPLTMPSASSIISPSNNDPWAPEPVRAPSTGIVDPWQSTNSPTPPPRTVSQDPWSPYTDNSVSPVHNLDVDDFTVLSKRDNATFSNNNGLSRELSPDPFSLETLGNSLPNSQPTKKTPLSFLGENSALVNLDNLVPPPNTSGSTQVSSFDACYNLQHDNYLGYTQAAAPPANPFAAVTATPPKPTINQMMQNPMGQQNNYKSDPWAPVNKLPNPLIPASSTNSSSIPNPFLS